MEKYDVKKAMRGLYAPSAKDSQIVDVPPQRFIAVDGRGDPNTDPRYAAALEALYAVAYAAKFASKRELERDFVVAPLEGLWWGDPDAYARRQKSEWEWTMMISLPEWVDGAMIDRAAEVAAGKKDLPALPQLTVRGLEEGRCVQILHIGSFDDETATLARLHHDYMPSRGLVFNGDHHEIYLNDPRRTAPEKVRVILRQPVRDAG